MGPYRLFAPVTILLFSSIVPTSRALLLSPLQHVHHYQQIIETPKSSPQTVALFSIVPSSTTVEQDDKISTSNNNRNTKSETSNDDRIVEELGTAFSQKISELEEYRRKNGHCLVPKRYEGNPSLGNWVNKQRQNYRKFLNGENTSMNEERILALDEIGFVWNASSTPIFTYNDRAWQKSYNELSQFQVVNGHCQVPSRSPLGQWVVRQRFLYRQYPQAKKSLLSGERINLLNDLNFPWMTRWEQLWERRINELREFKEENGHVMVTRKYPPNPQLSAWVATQRKNYNRRQAGKPSQLTLERIEELEEMGFVWSYWDHNFMVNNS